MSDDAVWAGLEAVLQPVGSLFGQLLHVASLRNPLHGTYECQLLNRAGNENAVNVALKQCHADLFEQWLALNEADRRSDLARHLKSEDSYALLLLRSMHASGMLANLSPDGASDQDRQLFRDGIGAILKLQ